MTRWLTFAIVATFLAAFTITSLALLILNAYLRTD